MGDEGLQQGKFNISFVSAFLLGNLEECLEILIQTNRIPEAAFLARYVFKIHKRVYQLQLVSLSRTYLPNKISYVLELWRAEVDKVNKKVGQSLADPEKYDNLFPGFHDSIKTQQYLLKEKNLLPAHQASQVSS